jgi:predicted Zn-dependent peptidase
MFNNTHPDFIALMVLNTILGGYFGSRLMTSVREEKGLTYGIGSSLISYKEGGVWTISSEVAGEMRAEALSAIRQEMVRLTTELVSDSEMELVRNFMLGEMLRYFDGPFSSSDIYRTLQENKLDFDFYRRMENELRAITPQRILVLAKKYLQPDDFYVVVAGK